MTVAACVFDMDGLLLDTEGPALAAMVEACAELGLRPPEGGLERLIGRSPPDGARIIGEASGVEVDPERLEAVWDAALDRRLAQGIALRPGVEAALDRVAAAGLPTAIATSSRTARALVKLEKAGIRDRIGPVIGSDQVANAKPAPDLFLRAAAEIGVAPARCAAFEDSAPGVRAALAAGMTTYQVPDLVAPDAATRALGHAIHPSLDAAVAAALA